MRYSGIQPQYFPRLHYFARMLNADIFMVRDDAQFVRKHKYPNGKNDKSYQADSPIKQAYGPQLLSVPISHSGKGSYSLRETEISFSTPWVSDHLLTLKLAYIKSKNFSHLFSDIEKLLNESYLSLADLNISTLLWGLSVIFEEKIQIENINLQHINEILKKQTLFRLKEIRRSSESKAIKDFINMNANEKILALLREVGATEDYCGGTSIAAYIDHSLFIKNGITISVQNWKCANYQQQFVNQQGFIANLSIIDLLFNMRAQDAREILRG